MNEILKKSWVSPEIEIRRSVSGGKGMFAKKRVVKGKKVLVWGGKYVSAPDAKLAREQGKLVMQWDDDLFSIEDKGEDKAYYINHSCNPNIWMIDAHTLIAKKEITKDTELTVDYAMWEADESYISNWQCACGAETCRGKVTGQDWKIPRLQQEYQDHFSPLINKRIKNLKTHSAL